jgi:hypothetical protein
MIIILLLGIECSNIPSKEFNLFPLISELFNNKISILLPHIFGRNVLISEIAGVVIYALSATEEVAEVMIKNGMIEDILSVINTEVEKKRVYWMGIILKIKKLFLKKNFK